MNYKIINIYCPMISTDHHSSYAFGYYSDMLYAKEMGKGKDNWGGDCYVMTRQAIQIDNKIFLLDKEYNIDLDYKQSQKNEILKQQAKSKLSKEELDALGVKE